LTLETQLAVQVLTLATGLLLTVWGLRIFRLYVASIGLLFGGVAGGLIGTFAFGSDQAALAGAVVGGVLGALLAWPLQKMVVVLVTAVIGSILAAVAVVTATGSDYAVPAAIGGFIAGAIIAIALFDIVVICAMALNGAQLVFHAVFVPADSWIGTPRDVAMRILGIYVDNVLALGVTTVMFVAFAWWYQRRFSRKRIAADPNPEPLLTARRIPFRLAAMLVAAVAATAGLAVLGKDATTSLQLLGFHALSWPLVAVAAVLLVRPRPARGAVAKGAPPGWRNRSYLAVTVFGLVVPPLVTAALFFAYGFNPEAVLAFYRGFISAPPAVIAMKAGLSFGVLPLILVSAVPRSARRPVASPEKKAGAETAPLAATPA
jgi:hypothetical protein